MDKELIKQVTQESIAKTLDNKKLNLCTLTKSQKADTMKIVMSVYRQISVCVPTDKPEQKYQLVKKKKSLIARAWNKIHK